MYWHSGQTYQSRAPSNFVVADASATPVPAKLTLVPATVDLG